MRSLGLLLLLSACGAHTQREINDVPRWRTEKDQVRLEIVEKLLEGGDNGRALYLIEAMREEGVKRDELDMYQGIAMRQQGMVEDAERLLLVSKANMPRNAQVYRALCVLYADEGQVAEAIAECTRATELDRYDHAAWNNLGFLLMSEKRHAESIDALRTAVDLEPTSGRYRNNLAFAQAANGDHRAALKTFLTTGSPADAHYNVGAAFERAGDGDRALSYYRRALKYDADHTHADEAIQRLQSTSEPQGEQPSQEM